MADELRKLIAQARELLAEAPSAQHERIRGRLDDWAVLKGFPVTYQSLSGLRPDVLRGNAAKDLLFVGDAKVSANEGPGTWETLLRLSRYLEAFASMLRDGKRTGGIIAVATDDETMAREWAATLALLAGMEGLHQLGGAAPVFKVTDLGDGTWVTWW
jgi:hypothetical protein